jgi:hypothetical protein
MLLKIFLLKQTERITMENSKGTEMPAATEQKKNKMFRYLNTLLIVA